MHTSHTLQLSKRALWAIVMIGVIMVVVGQFSFAMAQNTPGNDAPDNDAVEQTNDTSNTRNTGDATLPDPLKAKSFGELLNAIAKLVRDIGFYVAVIFILYSGLLFITARGSEDKLTKAKEVFKWTIIGVFIVTGASVLVSAIVNTVQSL